MFSAGEWKHRAGQEIIRLTIAEVFAATQREKDIIRLKKLMWNIEPYSRWWRWGYVGALKRAIRALDGTDKAGKAARETGGEVLLKRGTGGLTMRVDMEWRPWNGSIWLKRGDVNYGANWHGKGPVRKRVLIRAMMKNNMRYRAPWLWD